MFSLLRTLCLIAITVAVTIFVVQNLATTEVAFFTWSIAAPRAAVVLLVFVMGLVAGYLLHAIQPRRRKELGKPAQPTGSPDPPQAV
jgi:uncharacterized integral membrane protein